MNTITEIITRLDEAAYRIDLSSIADVRTALVSLRDEPLKIWTCAVVSPNQPGVVAFIRKTEGECFEALRDVYDPEGDADDEPPVAIVEHLQDAGYTIDIDVHEVARS